MSPPTYASPFLRAVHANPLKWLLPPYTNEIFDSSHHFLARLQVFALGQAFAVVTGRVYWQGVLAGRAAGHAALTVPVYLSTGIGIVQAFVLWSLPYVW